MLEKEELKEKLLSTNCFEDNGYLDQYCELICNNAEQEKIKYKTQSHHILPKCYFTSNNLEIDNSQENLVNLLYKDHILAHYYLCLCTERIFRGRLFNGLLHLVSINNIQDFEKIDLDGYQQLYEEWREYHSQYLKGLPKPPVSEETRSKMSAAGKGRPSHRKGKSLPSEVGIKISTSKLGNNSHFTPEVRQKMSKGRKGKSGYKLGPRSEEVKRKISQTRKEMHYKIVNNRKGTHISEETKRKISEANKGKSHPYTEEAKLKLSKALKGRKQSEQTCLRKSKPIYCIETGKQYLSIKMAKEETKISSIDEALKYPDKTAGGYHWRYLDK